jgi:1-phosphofructokinase
MARSPNFEPVEHRGAGDSFTGGVAAGLAVGYSLPDAVRLGVASGALNVTRHGLGSGSRRDIEALAERVELVPM